MNKLIMICALIAGSFSASAARYYINHGYSRSNGTYVMPHLKTTPDEYRWNNVNPSLNPYDPSK